MKSLVLELQAAAMDGATKVDGLVRKALVVATKLKLNDFREWCERELHGYASAGVPDYRRVKGQLKARNPYHGWVPVVIEDSGLMDALSSREVGQSVAELEHLASRDGGNGGTLQIPLPHHVLLQVFGRTTEFRLGLVPTLLISRTEVHGILDAVRNRILEWSLKLETEGVLGEGMTFSTEEVKRASNVTYNIQEFSGVLGDVSHSQVQIGDYNSIRSELRRLGVPAAERNELEEILDDLPRADEKKKLSLAKRGLDWLMRNGATLGALSDSIRGWFEPHTK